MKKLIGTGIVAAAAALVSLYAPGAQALPSLLEQRAQAYVCPYAKAYDRCVANCYRQRRSVRRGCYSRCRSIRAKCRRPSQPRRGPTRSRGI